MRSRLPLFFTALLAAFSVSLASPLCAQESSVKVEKIDPHLRNLAAEFSRRGITSRNAASMRVADFSSRFLKIDPSGEVQIYLHLLSADAEAVKKIEQAGARVEIVDSEVGIVQAWAPFDALSGLAALPFVKRITPPSYGVSRLAVCASQAGNACQTEGVAAHHADALQALGIDGTGVKVGVISDGADSLCNAVSAQELPAGITVFGTCNDSNPCGCSDGDEGVAMMEIVHDMAPGATLAFGAGLGSTLDFRNRIDDLKNTFGADVIVDDLGFFLEPYFEDGPVALKVKDAVTAGIVYASAGGNDAQEHYEGDYVDSGDGNHSHLISSSNSVFNVTGFNPSVILQWNDAFGSSGNDYDLCLSGETASTCASFNTQQGGTDDPVEFRDLFCSGGCQIQVRKITGADRRLEIYVLGGTLSASDHVAAGSVFGHPCVPGVLAAGAIDASDPGLNNVESYSSQGPCDIFFPSVASRQKPEISALDGVEVGGFGGFPSPFFGTSAAAPHVAGAAALLLDGLATTDTEVRTALMNTAVDIEGAGFDLLSGSGRMDVLAAAATFDPNPPNSAIDAPASDTSVEQGQPLSFTGTCTDPDTTNGMTFLWTFGAGSGVANKMVEDPGNVVFTGVGVFTVSFQCTDGFLHADASPDTRQITVTPAPDTDGDGKPDFQDNCVNTSNADQKNNDKDAQGDACDPDDDNDGVLDTVDNCPFKANADQADTDGNGAGDACDPIAPATTGGTTTGDGTAGGGTTGDSTGSATGGGTGGETTGDTTGGETQPSHGGCSLLH